MKHKSPEVKMENGQQRALQCIAICPLLIVFAFFVIFAKLGDWF